MSDDSALSAHSAGPVVRSTLVRSHCAKCREETLHKAGRCIHCATETRQPEGARTSVGDALIEATFSRPKSREPLSMTRSAIEQRRLRNVEKGRLWRAKKKAERSHPRAIS